MTGETNRDIRLREHKPNTLAYIQSDLEMIPDCSDSLTPGRYRFQVNENGFIVTEGTEFHKKPDLTIAFLGGSTTECSLMDEEVRFPHLVGQLLSRRTGLRVNAYNAARSGNHSMHSIDILLNKIIPLQPDIVVFMHNINDLNLLLYEEVYWNKNTHRSLIKEQEEPSMRTILKEIKDYLLPNLWLSIQRLKTRVSKKNYADEFASIRGQRLAYNVNNLKKEFGLSLRTFVAICQARDIMPVLMTQPSRLIEHPHPCVVEIASRLISQESRTGLEYQTYRGLFIEFNEVIRKVAAESNIPMVDLAARIPQEERYMYDVVHYTSLGSKVVAEIIAETLSSAIPGDVVIQ